MLNQTPKDEVLAAVSPLEYWQQEFPEWDGVEAHHVNCPRGELHESGEDRHPSLSLSPDNGAFYCYGCGWKGTSILGYHTDIHTGGNFKRAIRELYAKHVRAVISRDEVVGFAQQLIDNEAVQRRILQVRGWTPATLKRFRLGWDPLRKRVVIPIFNLADYCLDLKFHDTIYRAPLNSRNKRVPILGLPGARNGNLFPISSKINPLGVDRSDIWIVEGEPDAITATQDGINSITVSGGSGVLRALPYEVLQVFEGKDVILCLDNDEAGRKTAKTLAERLAPVGVSSLKNIVVPQGKDLSEFFIRHGGSAELLRSLVAQSPYLLKSNKKTVVSVPLALTSQAEYYNRPVRTEVLVNGKHYSPLCVPKRIKISCYESDRCSVCPCKDVGQADYFITKDDPKILEWLRASDTSMEKLLKHEMHLPRSCHIGMEIVEQQTLERLSIIPALPAAKVDLRKDNTYTARAAYYIGHGLESNQTYRVKAVPLMHPKTKESTLIVHEAKTANDSIQNFKLTPEDYSRLKSLFTGSADSLLKEIADDLSTNHTRIYGRRDLHVACDIAFHSPMHFSFAGVQLPKGAIELLLVGDARCGKGQVAEGLLGFYNLGSVVSGEGTSFMGLLGGATKSGDAFQLTWGSIPLNHGRLVVVDEFSGLSDDVLGRLSRVRSEGVAELNKGGIIAKTAAVTRLIWIANPRKGRMMSSFASGVEAIMDLVKANEDVARFDLALVVAMNEVDIQSINRLHKEKRRSRFTQEDLRKVVLWVWSRTSDQIVFTDQATSLILAKAVEFSEIYSTSIPLIQGENVRFKLAKIAAAVAGRCFSTTDGVLLRVTEEHVRTAVSIITHFYSKPSMGYLQYSELEKGASKLTDRKELDKFFKQWPPHITKLLVDGLLSVEKFSINDIRDWLNVPGEIARKFAGLFVRCHAVQQSLGGFYTKKPSFIRYLKRQKKGNSA